MTLLDPRDPFLVSKLAERAPMHDPTACTRQPCGRCRPSTAPNPPTPHPRDIRQQIQRTINPFDPLIPTLTSTAGHAPDRLAELMLSLAAAITHHGHERWERLLAWETRNLSVSLVREEPPDPEPGSDGKPTRPALTSKQEQDRTEDAKAARYAQDARTTTAYLHRILNPAPDTWTAVHDSVVRLRFLIAVAETRKPRQLKSREIQAAQAAADGWCRSCFRVGVFEPIQTRPGGEPFYRDLCRWCGSHKGALDQPPVDMLRIHHRIPERRRAS